MSGSSCTKITFSEIIGVSARYLVSETDRTCRMGRRSKGTRVSRTLRLPEPIVKAAQCHFSETGGGNLNDLVVELLEERLADKLAALDADETSTSSDKEEVPQTAA